ncbi:MAG: hypothetical protein JEZ12_22455 [Desulfobacterium sp.]|nr:hypothetical protein [Desulfobacterium sp.]
MSGCATLNTDLPAFNTNFRTGAYTEAGSLAAQKAGQTAPPPACIPETKNLLWALQAGAAKRACGEYDQSTAFFDASENAIKDYNETGILGNAGATMGSILINDTVLGYPPEEYDGIMVNTYKALNFWAQGNIDNARVEFLRALERQTRAKERFAKQIAKEKEALAKKQREADEKRQRQLAAATTPQERRAIKNSPRLDFNKAVRNPEIDRIMGQRYSNLNEFEAYPDFINPVTTYLAGLFFSIHGEYNKAADLLKETYGMVKKNGYVAADFKQVEDILDGKSKPKNLVWVIFENGTGPEKEEVRVDLPIFLFTNQVKYTGLAFPKLKTHAQAYPYLTVENNGKELGKTQLLADMDRVIQTEFKKDLPGIITKAVISALLKTYAQYEAQKEFGDLGGIIGGVYQLVTTSADVRIWTALPKNFQVARVVRPENGMLRIVAPGAEPMDVQLPETRFSVIYVKIPQKGTKPVYEILKT